MQADPLACHAKNTPIRRFAGGGAQPARDRSLSGSTAQGSGSDHTSSTVFRKEASAFASFVSFCSNLPLLTVRPLKQLVEINSNVGKCSGEILPCLWVVTW
jgi:hypothetical protein